MGRALSVSGASELRASSASEILSINATKVNAAAPKLSPGVFPANLHGMRRCFPARWAQFLNAHFQSATHVAAFFDVDHHTARGWLNGRHGANGPAVLFAVQRIPGALAMLLEDAA